MEYDCADCGVHVFAFGIAVLALPSRCAACAFIADAVAEIDRPAVRAILRERGVIGEAEV
jgi:hypothetical protein